MSIQMHLRVEVRALRGEGRARLDILDSAVELLFRDRLGLE